MAEVFYKKQAEQLSDEELLKSVALGVNGSIHSLTISTNNLSELVSRLYGKIAALEDSLAESIELTVPSNHKKRGRPKKEEVEGYTGSEKEDS